ncbi:MAG: hypothetical protein K9L59_10065 [Desulfobacterales bacterium]|nr:hypothetical protein [Desulfobacterales bacterium]
MDEFQILKRRVELKSQAVKLMAQDLDEHRNRLRSSKIRLFLLVYRRRLEKQMGNGFDRGLSRRLDAVQFLLDAEQETGGRGF